MNTDCAWFTSNLEAYCCETLDERDLNTARGHLSACASCKAEIDALEKIDPLVQRVFHHRLATSGAKYTRRLRFMPITAGATAIVAVAVVVALSLPGDDVRPPVLQLAAPVVAEQQELSATAPEEPKDTVAPPIQRAKPDDEGTPGLQARPDLDTPAEGGPDFAVIDAAGYSTNLENYKGHYVVVGVWSDQQPQTVDTMNRIYSAFGHDQKVRVLGVASTRQEPLDRATFPVVFNKGSQLLGFKTGEVVVIDKSGHQRWNGSLTLPAETVVSRIKSAIESAQ